MSLTVASIVKNEGDRFLEQALKVWSEFADRIVVLDDGSTDETPILLKAAGVEYHRQDSTMFGNEWIARKALWDLVRGSDGWVLHLDADQIPSCDPRPHLQGSITAFRVYDLWSESTYREDAWWTGHKRGWWPSVYAPAYVSQVDEWNERGWHSGHIPSNVTGRAYVPDECAILHYAYVTPELRAGKDQMYKDLADVLTPKEIAHARTINMPCRTLPLPFEPTWSLV